MNPHEWMSDRLDELEAEVRLARDEAEVVNRQLAETGKQLAATQERLDAAEAEIDALNDNIEQLDEGWQKRLNDKLAATQERLDAAEVKLVYSEELARIDRSRASNFEKALAASEAAREKFGKALERIALLDFADGHELTLEHASRAVAIACRALGKHPSEIVHPCAATAPSRDAVLEEAATVADEWPRGYAHRRAIPSEIADKIRALKQGGQG